MHHEKANIKRILIVKTSSLGDVIHTLPVLNDIKNNYPSIEIDWVVEKGFSDIVKSHPYINKVFEISFRKWRKKGPFMFVLPEFNCFRRDIKKKKYDLIIDAQGLLKSAYIASLAKGPIIGFDKKSIREPIANIFYKKSYNISKEEHAIKRVRSLFAKALFYEYDDNDVIFYPKDNIKFDNKVPYFVFLHGTTWESKKISKEAWVIISKKIKTNFKDHKILLFYGNDKEHLFAKELFATDEELFVIKNNKTLLEMKDYLSGAKAVFASDTGLAHLSGALNTKTFTYYGPTSPDKTGVFGSKSLNLKSNMDCSPCFKKKCPKSDSLQSVCLNNLSSFKKQNKNNINKDIVKILLE